jgi:hypothetical protein
MQKYKIYLFILIAIIACVPGPLFVSNEDVSGEVKLWGDYKKMGIYKLMEDVFIRNVELPLPNKQILVAPREKTIDVYTLHFSSPNSISEYDKNKDNWKDIKGIVRAGVQLQVTKLIKYKPAGYPDSLYIYARILDGPYVGQEIEISELSLHGPKSGDLYIYRPNSNLLRKK